MPHMDLHVYSVDTLTDVQSVSVSPFIINYSGCIFREYPGPWQVLRPSKSLPRAPHS